MLISPYSVLIPRKKGNEEEWPCLLACHGYRGSGPRFDCGPLGGCWSIHHHLLTSRVGRGTGRYQGRSGAKVTSPSILPLNPCVAQKCELQAL